MITTFLIYFLLFFYTLAQNPGDKCDILERAANYIFSQMPSVSFSLPIFKSDFFIQPQEITLLEPRCHYMYCLNDDPKNPLYKMEECFVLSNIKKLFIKNNQKIITIFPDYLVETIYSSITLSLNDKVITFNYQNETFNYNKYEPIFMVDFLSERFSKQMDEIGTQITQKYKEIFKSISKVGTDNLEGYLGSVFNVLYMNGPYINVTYTPGVPTDNQMTYISFNNPQMKNIAITAKRIFIGELMVKFDYAIDFDINCNEGSLTFYDFEFSPDDSGPVNSTSSFAYEPRTKLLNVIEDLVVDFHEKFKEAKKNYTQFQLTNQE